MNAPDEITPAGDGEHGQPPRRRRVRAAAIATAVVLALAGAGAVIVTTTSGAPAPPQHAAAAPLPSAAPSPVPPRPAAATPFEPPAETSLATTHGSIPRFARPGGPQTGTVPGSWHGAQSVLPVISEQPGWLDVRLAQRPNESTAWVRASDVSLTSTPYAIVIDLASTHLYLFHDGRQIMSAPAGVGAPGDPTPTGTYFTAFFAAPPSPDYGAFVMVTSAHSDEITDWEESGDAMIAIHGPLGGDQLIGTTGSRISHGCVRLHEADLQKLRDVPAGSPIYILASDPAT